MKKRSKNKKDAPTQKNQSSLRRSSKEKVEQAIPKDLSESIQKRDLTPGEIHRRFTFSLRKATNQEKAITFPIVGIGASAGGIEAVSELLSHLPSNTGMAFVVIQHLAADRKSALPEILSRQTQMTVQQADHLMLIQPNHVYVIPPNQCLGIIHGFIQLMPRLEPKHKNMPIDFFLSCLSEDQKSNAIGIILSGGDADGTIGLQRIKAEGGVTFVQDPNTAKVSSMPQSAIASGSADYVLNLKELAAELSQMIQHPLFNQEPSEQELLPDSDDGGFVKLYKLLRSKTGVDFAQYKKQTFQRRLKRRMVIHRIETVEKYVEYLHLHSNEIKSLYEDLLIHITHFFRDTELFEELKKTIFPKLLDSKKSNEPIRIWIPGCATGEEVYSIAISLFEALAAKGSTAIIQIFGTDLSEKAIFKARSGIYPEDIRMDVTDEFLRKYFVKTESGYQISRSIRDVCVFAIHDLTCDPPFSRIDLISCRNVLIYLSQTVQRRVMQVFAYALRSGGFLVLGPSETASGGAEYFSLTSKKYSIYTRKMTYLQTHLELRQNALMFRHPETPGSAGTLTKSPVQNREVRGQFQEEVLRTIIEKYKVSCVLVNDNNSIVEFFGKTKDYLEHISGEASLDVFKLCKNGIKVELRAALRKAAASAEPIVEQDIEFFSNGKKFNLNIEVRSVHFRSSSKFYLIFFDELHPSKNIENKPVKELKKRSREQQNITRLQEELAATTEYLKSSLGKLEAANEELQSANEEIISSNEELQRTNEELETAKEELQSSNEELTTLNEELSTRNLQLSLLNDDLRNLLATVDIAIIMVDNDLRIRRFTPKSERLLNLISSDTGRPITDIKPNFDLPDLKQMIVDTIDTMVARERQILDTEGKAYIFRIRPFRTTDNRIEGAVLTFFDMNHSFPESG